MTTLTTNPTEYLQKKTANLQLADLINRSKEELDKLYLLAATPTIEELIGPTNGTVLYGEIPVALTERYGRYMVNQPWLPWKGKVFEPVNSQFGRGKNRIEVGPFKTTLFKFETSIAAPLIGADDVFSLNYDLVGNPPGIRQVRDDIKKLRDGLYLGTANMYWQGAYRFVLYFALELK